jgi:hypothetical protein
MAELQLFYDKQMNVPLGNLDLGVVDLGTEKTIELWIYNSSDRFFIREISVMANDPDITVSNYPTELGPKALIPFIVRFSPKESRRVALNTIVAANGKLIIT